MDILGIGCAAVDDVLYVSGYPVADSKAEVNRRERRCGGLTAIALIAAARLGASCSYAGVLGDDELSRYVLQVMRDGAVDTSTTVLRPEARPAYSVIVVDESTGTRTILSDIQKVHGADDSLPSEQLIRSARVLFIDHFGIPGMIRACRIARESGIPVVADFERHEAPRFQELLGLVDHLILSRDFAARLTGQQEPPAAARSLWRQDRSAVVITAGREGCWYVDKTGNGQAAHLPAFKVKPLDTTGCGDVFHGAYAAALARGLPLRNRLRLASAAAALKAANVGGPAGIPTAGDVDQFLKNHCRDQ